MVLKLPAKIFLFLQKMNLRTLYFKPIVAKTLVHTLYPIAIWDEVCRAYWPESSALGGVADFSVGNIANRRQHLPRKSFFLLGNVASGRQCCGRHGNVANRSIT